MTFSRIALLLLFSLGLFFIKSCSEYQNALRSDDPELKFETAVKLYEEEDYTKAIRLFSDIISVYRGTEKAQIINYYFAKAHFKQRDYILASHYFQSFASAYPNSEHAEEFRFLAAYCKYLDSPVYSLDQTVTREAIQKFQRFINQYPNSEKVAEANKYIDELRYKLQKKRFENSKLYFRIGDYRAAAISFNNLIIDYPGTTFEEDALFYILKSYYEYANMSIPERQPERYEKAVKSYNDLMRRYPETKYKDDAGKIHQNVKEFLKEHKTKSELVSY